MGTDTHFKNNRIIRYTFSVASSLTPSLLSLFVSDTSQETHPDTSVAGDARHHMHAQQRDHYCTGKKPTQLQGEQAESDHYNSTCKKPTQLQGNRLRATTVIVLAKTYAAPGETGQERGRNVFHNLIKSTSNIKRSRGSKFLLF